MALKSIFNFITEDFKLVLWDAPKWILQNVVYLPIKGIGRCVGLRKDGKWSFEHYKNFGKGVGNVIVKTKNALTDNFLTRGIGKAGRGLKNGVSSIAGKIGGIKGPDGSLLDKPKTALGWVARKARYVASTPYRLTTEALNDFNIYVAPYVTDTGKIADGITNSALGKNFAKTGEIIVNLPNKAANVVNSSVDALTENINHVSNSVGNIINTTANNILSAFEAGIDGLVGKSSPLGKL